MEKNNYTLGNKLAEIRARCEKATPGPWLWGTWNRDMDSDFIAHARQDVPMLLEALEFTIDILNRIAKADINERIKGPRKVDPIAYYTELAQATLEEISALFEDKK